MLQVQDQVWVRALQEGHLDVDWFPQDFGDWVVCLVVEGAVRRIF